MAAGGRRRRQRRRRHPDGPRRSPGHRSGRWSTPSNRAQRSWRSSRRRPPSEQPVDAPSPLRPHALGDGRPAPTPHEPACSRPRPVPVAPATPTPRRPRRHRRRPPGRACPRATRRRALRRCRPACASRSSACPRRWSGSGSTRTGRSRCRLIRTGRVGTTSALCRTTRLLGHPGSCRLTSRPRGVRRPRELRVGQEVEVALSDGTWVTFRVRRVATFANADFPASRCTPALKAGRR